GSGNHCEDRDRRQRRSRDALLLQPMDDPAARSSRSDLQRAGAADRKQLAAPAAAFRARLLVLLPNPLLRMMRTTTRFRSVAAVSLALFAALPAFPQTSFEGLDVSAQSKSKKKKKTTRKKRTAA